jgi:hypothetical protein
VAYELGREAVHRELSVLDLATIYHEALLAALRRASAASEIEGTAEAGEAFFLESLSAFEMIRRGYREAREAALVEQRHAKILRQLSSFLGDASLAMGTAESLGEVLQLVAEHARELVGAGCCIAVATDADGSLEAVSHTVPDADWGQLPHSAELAELYGRLRPTDALLRLTQAQLAGETGWTYGWLAAPLTALDGSELGLLHLFGKRDGEFSDVDEAAVLHLAQMASAAIERARLYTAEPHR